MNNTLINNLLLIDRLDEQQIRLINRITQQVHLQEGDYYIEPGTIVSQLAFVDKGVLRYNYYTRKAENITSSLIGEGNFIAVASHLHSPVIQSDYLQAITECTLSVIGKSSMEELSATVFNWDSLVRKLWQKSMAERRSRIIRPLDKRHPEVTANQYLEKFSNLGKHLTVHQLLPYMNAQAIK